MRDYISLHINGQPIRVSGAEAFLTLSDFLRYQKRLTGTKVVCSEGDCGACATLIGRLEGETIQYLAVTSCILSMFQLDGAHVVTVEGLKQDGKLNPIQESMVSCHGTQCGFCTPGFVVSLHGLMACGSKCSEQQIRRGLVGNLCRCTGYDSIFQAAMQTDTSKLQTLDQQYPAGALLQSMKEASNSEVLIKAGNQSAYKPATLAQALKYRKENPAVQIVSGATDLGVLKNKHIRELNQVMYLGDLAEMHGVRQSTSMLEIGGANTITDLENAAKDFNPELHQFLSWFGSPLIKNDGTIAGNLVTGSPIGDSPPPLMAMGAEVELTSANGSRRVKLDAFYTGYRKSVMQPDEIMTRIFIPTVPKSSILKLYKVSRRQDLDISTFSAAILLERSGDMISDVRLFFGGVGPTVMRMTKTEAVLRGQRASIERFTEAARVAKSEVTPISDVRGSEEYRRKIAGNIMLRVWNEVFAQPAEVMS